MGSTKKETAKRAALDFHEFPKPGKLEIRATKPLANQSDLAKAYSPGVADACLEINKDAKEAVRYTSKANLVAVISNGSAVLGLGNIGPLASKPVMEGKAVLFKKFAGIDCFDIEIKEEDPYRLAKIVSSLEPTFGAINLEDIKAPDCFIVEEICRENMNIPVFHDDQHGTAIVVGAALINSLHLVKKKISEIKVVATGGGAAGIACLKMLMSLGCNKENIWLCDRAGLVTKKRNEVNEHKAFFAQDSELELLEDVISEADFFLGLSGPKTLSKTMLMTMNPAPIIFALANPVPEIMPEVVHESVENAIVATGRSDYPNQVNNVLCFPFIFRGALDVGATEINEPMKIACVHAIAELAREHSSAEAAAAYQGEDMKFGPNYVIPKPFDPRLLPLVASAVAKAAVNSGVATRKIKSISEYTKDLESSAYKTSMLMRPVFEAARSAARRIVFSEGEDERVLRASFAMLEETGDRPILIGRPEVVMHRIEKYGLPLKMNQDFQLVNPESDPRFRDYWGTYHTIMQRRGVSPALAQAILRTNSTAIASIMVYRNEADSMICGTFGQYLWHLNYIQQVLENNGLQAIGALSLMILENGPLFIADTQINAIPSPEQITQTVIATARHARRFGVEPKIALCSHSQFGSLDNVSGRNMRRALELLDQSKCDFSYEGEMHSDAALDPELRSRIMPNSRFDGPANALVFANTDAASGVRNILKMCANGLEVGPILMGMGNKAHIVTPSITARGLLNIAALAGTPVQTYG